MARKVLLETGYTFTPSTKTLVIPRIIPRERLVLITNVTTNQVIYNFSDANLKATSYTTSAVPGSNTTTIVLNYNTASMSSTDKIQFLIDEYEEKFTPAETYTDPVNKFRTSSPQALIDTDFEYGPQSSKWESVTLLKNRPFQFPNPPGLSGVGTITMPAGSKTVTIQVTGPTPPNGTPILVQDALLNIANGLYVVESGGGTGTITYTARAQNNTTITNIFDTNKTGIFSGSTYTGAAIGSTPMMTFGPGVAVTVTTTTPHGLSIGNNIAITGVMTGSYNVASVLSPNQFIYYGNVIPSTVGVTTSAGITLYARPTGQVLHRPFDGGVIFSSNANSNYNQTIRQTRRFFRYQSGKGIQVSTGSILKPNFQVDSLTYAGGVVTVLLKENHNILPSFLGGTTITVQGANESGYNGTFVISSVTGSNSFTYVPTSTPSAATASGPYTVSGANWYGAVNRLGIFEGQNGIFYEFDGTTMYAVRRSSTFQIAGRASVTNGSCVVTQSDATFPTSFSKQLVPGDYIVIRGQSYLVTDIASDTSMTISPAYRGTTATFTIISRTVDLKIPQSQWNIDKCDGTGPSGYNLDLSRMQMFYMDYSWYGAGFIRWGFRGPDGNIIYCHKLANNNLNYEAYMRSGNLPARYETYAIPALSTLVSTLNASDTTISVASTAGFPSSGTLLVRNASTYEYINYSNVGSGTSTFTGLTRAQAGATPSLTISSGSNVATAATTGLQVGQRAINDAFPLPTFVSSIGAGSLTLSNAATSTLSGIAVTFVPMGATSGQTFTYSATAPTVVEFAYPTFAPTISHWGSSVIMDGRFDDDKSLVFTYGQNTQTSVPANASRALFSIRIAPSVDNGIAAAFGARELTNRMQLTLKTLDLSVVGIQTANILLRAYLNGVPSTATPWTNAVGNTAGAVNSSLAQIADYGGGSTTVSGGEVTAGYWASQTGSIDISNVRDLGNAVLGGGGTNSNTQIYPDGPDVLTIVATNVSPYAVNVYGRISWTEAQA